MVLKKGQKSAAIRDSYMNNSDLLLTIIVTVYNEKETIVESLRQITALEIEKEIIVVDNCSTDGTQDLLKKHCSPEMHLILQPRNMGYGQSIITGCNLAKGKYLYVHNSDLEYDPAYAIQMIDLAQKENLDAVFGSRLAEQKGSVFKAVIDRPYFLAAAISTFLVNVFYKKNLTDIIGSKFYKVASLKSLYPFSDTSITFDFELVSKLCKRGFRIAEIPVSYSPRGLQEGQKKIKWYNSIPALVVLLKIKFFD
jgi:dolichol-phosphate mannosyltransferase